MDPKNPQQALKILAQVTATVKGTREEHDIIKEALLTLAKLIPQPSTESQVKD